MTSPLASPAAASSPSPAPEIVHAVRAQSPSTLALPGAASA